MVKANWDTQMKLLVTLLFLYATQCSLAQASLHVTAQITDTILSLNKAMEREFNNGNFASIGEFYATDGVMVGNKVEIVGKSNLIHYWGQFKNTHPWTLETIEIKVLSPELVLQRGFSNITYYKGSELQNSRSIFSLVWVKKEDTWEIMLDHFSPR